MPVSSHTPYQGADAEVAQIYQAALKEVKKDIYKCIKNWNYSNISSLLQKSVIFAQALAVSQAKALRNVHF
jgi:hypothetical protein